MIIIIVNTSDLVHNQPDRIPADTTRVVPSNALERLLRSIT
jgi:hypothetical protein